MRCQLFSVGVHIVRYYHVLLLDCSAIVHLDLSDIMKHCNPIHRPRYDLSFGFGCQIAGPDRLRQPDRESIEETRDSGPQRAWLITSTVIAFHQSIPLSER